MRSMQLGLLCVGPRKGQTLEMSILGNGLDLINQLDFAAVRFLSENRVCIILLVLGVMRHLVAGQEAPKAHPELGAGSTMRAGPVMTHVKMRLLSCDMWF